MAVLQNNLLCYFQGAISSAFWIFCQKQVLSLLCRAGRCVHGAVLLGGRFPFHKRSQEHGKLGTGSVYAAAFKTASQKFYLCICQPRGCSSQCWWQPPKQTFHASSQRPLFNFCVGLPWGDALFSWAPPAQGESGYLDVVTSQCDCSLFHLLEHIPSVSYSEHITRTAVWQSWSLRGCLAKKINAEMISGISSQIQDGS